MSVVFRVLLFIFLPGVIVQAATLTPQLRDGGSRFLVRTLGSTCYTIETLQRGLPCNPAMVAKIDKSRFDGDFFVGSNIDYLRDAEAVLDDQSSEEHLAKLFDRREKAQGEISVELSYQHPTWGLSIEPYRIVYINQFQNSAMPIVDMLVAEEHNMKAQVASYVADNFYAGLQLRYSHVRYISGYFALSEIFSDEAQEIFRPQTQNILYLEPGFLYSWEDVSWKPQVSAMLSQWGTSSDKSDAYSIQPQGLLGFSVKPEVPLGSLELGTQFQVHSKTASLKESFRLGGTYKIGIIQAMLSISDIDHSGGFLVSYKSFTSGLSYWADDTQNTVFLQIGVSL